MKIPQPFIPLRAETENLHHTVHVLDRDYTFGPDGLITSIKSQGIELLSAPMRVVCVEDGEKANWDTDYPNNESESFVQDRSDEHITICGAKQSDRFIIDTCSRVEYDGNIDIDFKLMTRGKTVAQVFGLKDTAPVKFKIDKLWLEIPLKAEICSMFNIFENSEMKLSDGTIRPKTRTSGSGRIPEQNAGIPFTSLVWLGSEERGLGYFAESEKNWQPADRDSAIEIIHDGDSIILRLRLLDSHPKAWSDDPEEGMFKYYPITFSFGFIATPVKTFPKQPYIHNAFHLDCGIKIKGNYIDFMSAENRFDKLKEKGVTTLILHEKWNKSQNWFELSEFTANQIRYICDECHKRGIKVLTYFGYEISTMSPEYSRLRDKVINIDAEDEIAGGWWRVPFQRCHVTCYESEYADIMVNGIANIMDTYHTDGVYLDGTAYVRYCKNTNHGCGWYDEDGVLHGSYPLRAVRYLFKKLYDVVTSRGGEINVHNSCVNFVAMPFIHQIWNGEYIQFDLVNGLDKDMDLDYFRAEYIGRNMGVPVEFIAYENRPKWCFEHALSIAVLHGILPRPNDIEYPLELMSKVWKIFGAFPIEISEWMPYWKNDVKTSDEKVKVSYYKYTSLSGDAEILAFVVNISTADVKNAKISFSENVSSAKDMMTGENCGFTLDIPYYGCRILHIK